MHVLQLGDQRKVSRHIALRDRVEDALFQTIRKIDERGNVVELAALSQRTAPGKDRRRRVRRGLLAFQIAIVMPRDRAVCRLVFVFAAG